MPLSFIAMNFLAIDEGGYDFHRYNVQRVIQAVGLSSAARDFLADWLPDG